MKGLTLRIYNYMTIVFGDYNYDHTIYGQARGLWSQDYKKKYLTFYARNWKEGLYDVEIRTPLIEELEHMFGNAEEIESAVEEWVKDHLNITAVDIY